MRLPFLPRRKRRTRPHNRFIWLRNASTEHIILDMPSGSLRLDRNRRLRFRPEILEQPQVKDMIDSGRLVIVE